MADIVYPGQTPGQVLNSETLPTNSDLVIYKGDYVEFFVILRNALEVPIDITGWVIRAVLKSDYADRDPKPFVCTVEDGLAGEVKVFMSSEYTSQLLPGSYIWDLEGENLAEEVRTFYAGDVTVYNEVTSSPWAGGGV